jgi:cytidylate kinase
MNSIRNSEDMASNIQDIVAVDGYSSCGKSTFAQLIAKELNYVYIDSGAMYRAVALYCLENKIISDDMIFKEQLLHSLDKITIQFVLNPSTLKQETWLNGKNVEEKIRSVEISAAASAISKISEVRKKLVSLQRKIGENGHIVMDGRDIGTVVFPNARLKIFMIAQPEIRIKRRYDELLQKEIVVTLSEISENIRTRDFEDENRVESPLRKASDAFVLDNSFMTVEQQMEWFRKLWTKVSDNHEN